MTHIHIHNPPTGLRRRPLLPVLVAVLFASLSMVATGDSTLSVVGQSDPREGYGNADFQTRSTRIPDGPARRLDLAGLAADPPLGLPPLDPLPARAEIDLGRRLFYDRRLSANETLSCGICHVPEQAFTQNELSTPVGIEGRFVRRNAPSLYNVGYRSRLFHDGREVSLAEQIFSPLTAANEMGNPSRAAVLTRIAALPGYTEAFAALFNDGLTEANLGRVLAAYQRALLSADSPFDRWFYRGDRTAISDQAREGFFLFNTMGCASCHTYSNTHAHFTDEGFHRTGVEAARRARERQPQTHLQVAPGVTIPLSVTVPAPDRHDLGLEEVTGDPADRYRYRTPTLRNVALTGPYMHDGSLATLAEVIAFYAAGGGADPDRDPRMQPLDLDGAGKEALIAFLESLTSANVDALALDARSVPIGERSAHE